MEVATVDTATVISLLLAGGAVAVSMVALWLSWKTWLLSNRPIVMAVVETYKPGNVAVAYNLVVHNSGNRAALNVRLTAPESKIRAAFAGGAEPLAKTIIRCFTADATIPVLLPGRAASNAFGVTARDEAHSVWKYGSSIPIRVEYADLDGRPYCSLQVLLIRDTTGFAESSWDEG